jgi:hypothetical protein
VVVTVTDTSVRLSRVSVPVGLVLFEIRNRGERRHAVEVAGNATPKLVPGRSATLKVVFVRGGKYRLVAPGLRADVLRVVPSGSPPASPTTTSTSANSAQPCVDPTSSAVTVTMTDGIVPDGYTFSPASVPCGTVTFVLTNVGKLGHGLVLMDPRGQILPASSTVGPSQTVSVVEILRCTGTYQWADIISDTFGEDGIGVLVVR